MNQVMVFVRLVKVVVNEIRGGNVHAMPITLALIRSRKFADQMISARMASDREELSKKKAKEDTKLKEDEEKRANTHIENKKRV